MTPMPVWCLCAVHSAVLVAAASTTGAEPEPGMMYNTSIEPEPAPSSESSMTSTMSMSSTTSPRSTMGMSSSMTSTMGMSSSMTSTMSMAPTTQSIVQTVTLTSLDAFSDVAALAAAYTGHVASATNTDNSSVNVTVSAVVVKVTIALTGVTAGQIEQVKQAIATLAGVPVDAVTLVQSRRLREQSKQSEDGRRLTTTNWAASITVGSSHPDMVSKAKDIHTVLKNDTIVASQISNATGSTVTATTAVSFELTMTSVVATSATLDTSAIETAVSSGLNANVQTTHVNDAPLSSSTTSDSSTTTSGPVVSSDDTLLNDTDDAPWSSGYILVALMSVLFGIRTM